MLSNTPALYAPFDQSTGHGPWSPVGYLAPPAGASANVIINGRNVHKVGDTTLPHFASLPVPPDLHSDTISTGSPTVMVNGTPMAVIGSLLASPVGPAGAVAAFGATTVKVDSQSNPTEAATETATEAADAGDELDFGNEDDGFEFVMF